MIFPGRYYIWILNFSRPFFFFISGGPEMSRLASAVKIQSLK